MPRQAVVVEDDADTASLLESALSSQGFEVAIADNGDDGIALITELVPDLVTLDLVLPGIDGLEVCRRIRPVARDLVDAFAVPEEMLRAEALLGLGG